YIRGSWRQVDVPDDCAVLFAGDMLERLTNGGTPALLHRVTMGGEAMPGRIRSWWPSVRQSHILFLQPDQDTVVCPLRPFLSASHGQNLPPVRYGDWHKQKVCLAFNLHEKLPQAVGGARRDYSAKEKARRAARRREDLEAKSARRPSAAPPRPGLRLADAAGEVPLPAEERGRGAKSGS
ncbi:unnamed protein product, partial [Prorocentrum cordatum]